MFRKYQFYDEAIPRNLKGGIRSFFDPCVNAMGWRPYCSSRMEVSLLYLRFLARSFDVVCAHYRYRVIHRAITKMRVRFEFKRERQVTLKRNYLAGLATKKSGVTITHLHT